MKVFVKTKLQVSGLNLSRAIKELQSMGIPLFDVVYTSSKTLSFCVLSKDCVKVVAYLKKKCYNVTEKSNVGVSNALDFAKKHLVATLIFFVCMLCATVLGSTCQKIVVVAPLEVYDQVCDAVALQVTKGTPKKKIALDSVENAVCVAVPQVKYAMADFCGSQLTVSVKMRTLSDGVVDDTIARDVVASCDGVITRMLVLNGTPLVNVGDKVVKGQVLIKGQNVFADGTEKPATAKGEIWAMVQYESAVKFCPTVVKLLPTGSVTKRRRIKFAKYTSKFSSAIEYEYFSTETTYARLYPLGIVVEYETVYELMPTQYTVSLEDQLPTLQLQAYEKLKKRLNGIECDAIQYGTKTILTDTFVTVSAKTTQNIATGG